MYKQFYTKKRIYYMDIHRTPLKSIGIAIMTTPKGVFKFEFEILQNTVELENQPCLRVTRNSMRFSLQNFWACCGKKVMGI